MVSTTGTHTSYGEFVRSGVLTIPITEQIIKDIMPFFPLSAKVIAGFLSEEDLYWKVNYHWDVLLEALDHCLGLKLDNKYESALKAIKIALLKNPPDPPRGYRTSPVGQPKDKSSHETILERHKILSQCKRDFATVVKNADIFKKTKRNPKALMLAYAPVATPAKGKHKTGYALDIAGNNDEIVRITNSLGGYAFNEGSHVHCEWKHGVDKSGQGGADSVGRAARGTKIRVDQNIINVRHCLLQTA